VNEKDLIVQKPVHYKWMNASSTVAIVAFLVIATSLEVTGDAVVRLGIYTYAGPARLLLMLGGAALLFGYGTSVNLAPIEFRRVVGLYIATLFVMWQIINFVFFRTAPNPPILFGGTLIVIGGVIVTFWKAA
jgi:small multidrug resistance family-3 protein